MKSCASRLKTLNPTSSDTFSRPPHSTTLPLLHTDNTQLSESTVARIVAQDGLKRFHEVNFLALIGVPDLESAPATPLPLPPTTTLDST
jgi:hypothetical protein